MAKKAKAKKPAKPGKKLTPQQKTFVHALAADPKRNQEKAAIEAGYSAKTAKVIGSRLMNEPQFLHVREAYQAIVDARLAKYDVTESQIERTLAIIAFGNRSRIQRLVPGANGDELKLTPTDELFEDEMLMIEGYKEVSLNDGTGDTKIVPVFCNRNDALRQLCRARGMDKRKVEVKADVSISDVRESIKSSLAKLAALGGPGSIPGQPDGAGTPQPPV